MFEKHNKFREIYKKRQMNMLTGIGSVMLVYSVVALAFLCEIITRVKEHGQVHFTFLLFVSVITMVGSYCFKWVNENKQGIYCDIISFLAIAGYSTWGIYAVYYSIIENREINIITAFIIYSIFLCALNYNILVYTGFVIYLLLGILLCILNYHVSLDATIMVNYILMTGFLYAIGIMRYNYERAFSLAKVENEKNNEELRTLNDKLRDSNEEIKANNAELSRLNASQKLFTASMSHELRNPLNGVMGALKMLMMDDDLKNDQRRCVMQCYQSSNALLHIVNDLLDYSKMESGEFKIVNSEFDFKDVIEETMNMFRMFSMERGVNLKYIIADDLPCGLYGDSTRIQQIMGNLISNAIKYTGGGGTATVTLEIKDNLLTITVADTGEGMTEEVMKSLFVPYHRVQEVEHKKIKGTGLGLYIVRTLAELMGGTASVSSVYGEGSTFVATAKVEVVNPKLVYFREESAQMEEHSMLQKFDYSNLKVLVVDDSKVNVTIAAGLLKKGLKVVADTAYSGAECLERIKDKTYDFILLDHMMPEMDGVETLHRIKEMGIGAKVIALTANAGVDAASIYEGYGFDGYLSKPVLLEKLLEILNKFMEQG